MKLLVYNKITDTRCDAVDAMVEKIEASCESVMFRSMDELLDYLRTPVLPAEQTIVVFNATSIEELEILDENRDFIFPYRLIIIVPDNDREMIRRGHILRPRYLSATGCDTGTVSLIIDNMIRQIIAQESVEGQQNSINE